MGTLTFVVLYLAAAWKIYDLVDQFLSKLSDSDPSRYDLPLRALAYVYPAGSMLQAGTFGGEFLQNHLSDVGFPVLVGIVLSWCWIKARKVKQSGHARVFRIRRNAVVIGMVLSIVYELLSQFDPIDVLMYILGSVAAIVLLLKQRKAYAQRTAKLAMI